MDLAGTNGSAVSVLFQTPISDPQQQREAVACLLRGELRLGMTPSSLFCNSDMGSAAVSTAPRALKKGQRRCNPRQAPATTIFPLTNMTPTYDWPRGSAARP